ncbi:PAS domain-containing protein [Sorangium sp. So ce233]|uniref:sensor histidine kinase n=1 Tax=Sorangium sp. So ce233 TaxID=3133290 RepID=UPI003F627D38
MSLRPSRNETTVAAERGADDELAQSEQRSPRLLDPGPGQSTTAVVARAEQLDLMAVFQASQAISREIVLSRLLETLVRTIVQQAGAQRGVLILARDDELCVAAEARSSPGEIQVVLEDRELSAAMVPVSVILHVRRSRERVLLPGASGRHLFSDDPYLAAAGPRSILCLPVLGRTEVAAVLYLENDLLAGAFTPDRVTATELLVSQAAISLQNAMLYADLEQAALIVGSSPAVLFRWRSGPELMATYVSDNVATVLGHRPVDLLSGAVTFSSLVHPDDRERVTGEIAACAAVGRDRFEQEYRVVCGDGRVRWVDDRTSIERDATGRVRHYQSILADITEKRAADEPRRRSQELLSAIVDNTTAIVYAKDAERRILTVNRRFADVWGIPLAELIGTTGDQALPAEVAERFRENDLKAMAARAPVQMEVTLPQPDGVHTYISLKVPLCDASGVVHGVCGICTDITERVEAEKERERLLREAQEALRIRDEFLSIASHELKTPLTPLRLHMQLLRRHISDPALAAPPRAQSFHRLLEISNHQIERLTKLVDDLLDVSRISAGQLALQLEDVDLSSLASDAAEGFCQELSSAESRLSLRVSGPVVGRWDRFRIEQVLVNLLANAVKYGKGKPIIVGVQRRGALAELWVQDHGIGIPHEVQDRIFDRFERVVSIRSFGGLGLGLYITRRIIEAHRGTIRVSSAPGQGATFTVELPIGGS